VKFHCDKCKTRYSIGEDRVRGKILKIRCKNCGNVISVREGMESDAGSMPGARSSGTTAPAPPALEEEWYVSIDGIQSGPMSLVDAQRWVGGKPIKAELYCWSEGFDDWLSVDKVSHFRNLRKATPPPKPLPRAATAGAPPPIPAAKAARSEETPKPLFASTMASIEKDASGPVKATSQPAALASAAPVRTNGAASGPTSTSAATAKPAATGKGSGPVSSIPEMPRTRTPSGRFQAIKSSPATALALSDAFDAEESSDSATQVGVAPPMFGDEPAKQPPSKGFDFGSMSDPNVKVQSSSAASKSSPVPLSALAGASQPAAAKPAPAVKPTPAAKPVAAKPAQPLLADGDEDDDLSIGEVSRVVNLKDIVTPRARASTGAQAPVANGTAPVAKVGTSTGPVAKIGGSTQSNPRLGTVPFPKVGGQTSSQPKFSPTDLGMNVDPSLVSPDGPAPDESVVAQSFAQTHRRGMFALIGFAAALVAGVVVLVVVMTGNGGEDFTGRLGDTRVIDTSRPEDIVRKASGLPPVSETGSGAGSAKVTTGPRWTPRPNPNPNTQPEDPKGDSLRASEVEDMAAKNGEGTKRCYMRAQKGALGFEIADVKKIAVTLTVGKDGTVSNVDLSSHQADSFGQCLIARIKGWKFRESPGGGTFRISLAFSNG